MTQFESGLNAMRVNLEAEQQTFEQERWAQIRSTTLADYRKEQEAICNEGIFALQQQRDRAIAQKEEQLKEELKVDVERKFGAARQKLEEMQTLFAEPKTDSVV